MPALLNRILPWLETILFLLLGVSLFLNIQNVIVPNVLGGTYNEYLSTSVHLFDILFFLFGTIFILSNKYGLKSIYRSMARFHVEQSSFHLSILLFLVWAALSILYSAYPLLSALSLLHLIQAVTLFFVILYYSKVASRLEETGSVPRGTTKGIVLCSTWNKNQVFMSGLLLCGLLNCLVGMLQFAKGMSLGLTALGESSLNLGMSGVAKIVIDQALFLRSYGLFLHPNILAAFLGFLILILIYRRIYNVWNDLGICSTWNVKCSKFHVELILLSLLVTTFFLTFSKAGFLSLGAALAYLFYQMFHVERSRNLVHVPCGTTAHFPRFLLPPLLAQTLLILVLFCVLLGVGLYSAFWKSIFLQNSFLEREYGMIILSHGNLYNFAFGQSIGGYIPAIHEGFARFSPAWLLQPPHNLYLLIYAELGIVGLFLFLHALLLLWYVPRGTANPGKGNSEKFHVEQITILTIFQRTLLVYALSLGVFDHYFWDIPQGIFLLWIILATSRLSPIDLK